MVLKIIRKTVGHVATNCYIVYDEETKRALIIDPGENAPKILDEVEKNDLTIEYVLLTHAHFDHVLAVREVLDKTRAKLAAHSLEIERLKDPVASGHEYFHVNKKHTVLIPDVCLEDGDALSAGGLNAKILHTPGHSEGSICIMTDDVIFTGDTLFKENCGRCDLIGGNYSDMLKSLKKLYEIPGNYKIYPGHGESSDLEYERKNNPYMREAMRK